MTFLIKTPIVREEKVDFDIISHSWERKYLRVGRGPDLSLPLLALFSSSSFLFFNIYNTLVGTSPSLFVSHSCLFPKAFYPSSPLVVGGSSAPVPYRVRI